MRWLEFKISPKLHSWSVMQRAPPVGDPLEIQAVARVFGSRRGAYIGSIKPNIGHGGGASGISSLIKTVLALEKRVIPPNIFFDTPNPKIPLEAANFRVPVEAT